MFSFCLRVATYHYFLLVMLILMFCFNLSLHSSLFLCTVIVRLFFLLVLRKKQKSEGSLSSLDWFSSTITSTSQPPPPTSPLPPPPSCKARRHFFITLPCFYVLRYWQGFVRLSDSFPSKAYLAIPAVHLNQSPASGTFILDAFLSSRLTCACVLICLPLLFSPIPRLQWLEQEAARLWKMKVTQLSHFLPSRSHTFLSLSLACASVSQRPDSKSTHGEEQGGWLPLFMLMLSCPLTLAPPIITVPRGGWWAAAPARCPLHVSCPPPYSGKVEMVTWFTCS